MDKVLSMRRPTPLRLAIVASGRTQRSIAAEIPGLDEPTLSRIVNGLHCDEGTRHAISDALGVPTAELWPDEPVDVAA